MPGDRLSHVGITWDTESDGVTNSDAESEEHGFTDAELTVLALAAETGVPLAEGAVPLSEYLGQLPTPLPDWYMPPAMVRGCRRWRIPVVATVVGAFFLIEALGLCSTFGQLNLS